MVTHPAPILPGSLVPPAAPEADTPDALDALERLAVGAVAATSLALARSGVELTFAQWRVLVVLASRRDPVAVGEVADRIGSAASPASRLIARMRARGLLRTERDPRDRRVTRVRLSDEGLEVWRLVVSRRRELLATALAGCGGLRGRTAAALQRLGTALEALP